MAEVTLNEEAWSDFELLLNTYLSATERILQKDKFIIPMATILNVSGEPQFIALQPESEGDYKDAATHLKNYRKLLRQHPENTRACILAYDILIDHDGFNDAIGIELEHANGTHQKMFVPYRFSGALKNKLELGQSKLTEPDREHILSA